MPPAETPQPAPEDQRLAKYRVIEDLPSKGDSVVYRAEDTQLKRSVTINVLPESAARQAERRQRLRGAAMVAAGALAMAVVLLAVQWLRGPAPPGPQPLRRFAFTPESLHSGRFGRVAISPDGKHIVYLGGGDEPKLWVRDVDREQPRELAGTENALHKGLFWSPDSQFIGFAAGNELKKVSVQGGPAITLCPLPGSIWEGGAWSLDGDSIVFSSGSSTPVLHEVPARGGEPKLLFEPEISEKGDANLQPHFLPLESGARSIVYEVGGYTDREIVVKNLETGEREVLAEGAFPRYSPSGHILYQTAPLSPGLWALPFSLETLKPTGEAFPIAENAGDPSVAEDGTLVYVELLGGERQQLVWRDREGEKLEVIGQPQNAILYPALSPNGRQVAVHGIEDNNDEVWVHEVGRSLKRRLTFDAALDSRPIWSPSGKEITFRSARRGNDDIYIRPADGTGEPALLVGTPLSERPNDWSSDGKYLFYGLNDEETGWDLWYLKRKEDGSGFEPVPFLQTSFREEAAQFSPDGRFVAYVSNESGGNEVYVRPFPGGDGKWQVSGNQGTQPR